MDEAGPKLLRGLLEVFLLETLEREPKHGYAILKEMAESFGVEPNRNRLYPLLAKFVSDGWVREVNDGSGGRTIYSLTDEGRAQLHVYRKLPRAFRQSLARVWLPEAIDESPPPAPPAAKAAPPSKAAPAKAAPVPVRVLEPAAKSAPASPAAARPAIPVSALPYPCPDARVQLRKDPGTGDLAMEVTGCPMGTYDYCPQCPVFQAVDGIRRLVFSV